MPSSSKRTKSFTSILKSPFPKIYGEVSLLLVTNTISCSMGFPWAWALSSSRLHMWSQSLKTTKQWIKLANKSVSNFSMRKNSIGRKREFDLPPHRLSDSIEDPSFNIFQCNYKGLWVLPVIKIFHCIIFLFHKKRWLTLLQGRPLTQPFPTTSTADVWSSRKLQFVNSLADDCP